MRTEVLIEAPHSALLLRLRLAQFRLRVKRGCDAASLQRLSRLRTATDGPARSVRTCAAASRVPDSTWPGGCCSPRAAAARLPPSERSRLLTYDSLSRNFCERPCFTMDRRGWHACNGPRGGIVQRADVHCLHNGVQKAVGAAPIPLCWSNIPYVIMHQYCLIPN
eukprot:6044279-Pleurochrysis_carterae.AAC.1